MPAQDEIENFNEGDKGEVKQRPSDNLGDARAIDGKAVQEVQRKNRNWRNSMTDIPSLKEFGQPGSGEGFCLTEHEKIIASKTVSQREISKEAMGRYTDKLFGVPATIGADGSGSAEETGSVIDYEPEKTGDRSYALGWDWEQGADNRTASEKLTDFLKAAGDRATDPEGWQRYIDGQIEKFTGIGEGLNIAKEHTTAAVVAGWNALTDGTVADFLAKPNAINDPLFKAAGGALEAMANDPNAVMYAFERLGTALMQASEHYSSLPDREKGRVIGETMFGMVNPEGSTEGAQAALKVADQVATRVDQTVWDTIDQTVRSINDMAPDLAEQTKQALYDYIQSKGLTGRQLEAAGIPNDYFAAMQHGPDQGKGDNFFAMSKADEGGEGLPKRAGDREPVPEKIPPASARFVAELKQIVENLSESERNFLQEHGIEVKPIRRIADKFPERKDWGACYDPTENTIYVPEEVLTLGKFQPNQDLSFAFKHELGHALNAKSHPFGEWISDTKDFIEAFKEDWTRVSPEMRDALRLSDRDIRLVRDEVFSDLWAHSTGTPSKNPYSQLMKGQFPTVLKFFTERR